MHPETLYLQAIENGKCASDGVGTRMGADQVMDRVGTILIANVIDNGVAGCGRAGVVYERTLKGGGAVAQANCRIACLGREEINPIIAKRVLPREVSRIGKQSGGILFGGAVRAHVARILRCLPRLIGDPIMRGGRKRQQVPKVTSCREPKFGTTEKE